MLLVAPLLVLLLLSFCLPIAALLARAVHDPTMHDALPRTAVTLDASPALIVADRLRRGPRTDGYRAS